MRGRTESKRKVTWIGGGKEVERDGVQRRAYLVLIHGDDMRVVKALFALDELLSQLEDRRACVVGVPVGACVRRAMDHQPPWHPKQVFVLQVVGT